MRGGARSRRGRETLIYDPPALPETAEIRVCEVTQFGEPDVLQVRARPRPRPPAGELLVTVEAANVNPSDLAARSGAIRRRLPDLRPPFAPGWDLAGTVSEVPEEHGEFAVGDPVVGMIPWMHLGGRVGAYAEAVVVDPAWLAPRPPDFDALAACTIPLNALTARQALDLLGAELGASVLITGASGAVGGFATQLAARDGLRVLAVASDGDEDWVAGLGAAEVLSRDTVLPSVGPVDFVIDAVPLGEQAVAAVRDGGAAVLTRRLGDVAEGRDVRVETPLVQSDQAMLAELTRRAADGELRTRVAEAVELAQAAEAHRLVERGGLRGKAVLKT